MPVIRCILVRAAAPASSRGAGRAECAAAHAHGDIAKNVHISARSAVRPAGTRIAVGSVGREVLAVSPILPSSVRSPGATACTHAAVSADAGRAAAAAIAATAAFAAPLVVGSVIVDFGIGAAGAVAAARRIAACRREAALSGDVERHVARQQYARARAVASVRGSRSASRRPLSR